MQEIIIERPYTFVPPHRGKTVPWVIQKSRVVDWYLRKYEGVVQHELRGIDHLRESMRLGRGVLLTPNHCRYADPFVMGWVARAAKTALYSMASWHLFEGNRLQRWALQIVGAFSVNREAVDRQSLDLAVEILATGERPLVLFPEGAVFRTNDLLQNLLDGVAFIARTAAKRRQKEGKTAGVVIHPVAIKYVFHGDLESTVRPILNDIEHRLTWAQNSELPTKVRIEKILHALLTLKEIEYLGQPQEGTIVQRQQRLVDHLLHPLEEKWLNKRQQGAIIPRVKSLRMKIVPDLISGELTSSDRAVRWKNLRDIYLSQQIASYPEDYLTDPTTVTRVLETIERIEEDLTDKSAAHPPLEAIIEVGEAIEVPSERSPKGEEDPVMVRLRENLQGMLTRLASESATYVG